MRNELKSLRIPNTRIESAGLLDLGQRPADSQMINIGKKHDAGLTPHVSRQISLSMLKDADIIFVMEIRHKEELLKLAPEYEEIFFPFSLFDYIYNGINVQDPLDRSPYVYNYYFSRIHHLTQKLALLIKES